MNGAESLVRTLLANGVNTCFANPGTSEMHLVQAIDAVEGFRAVLCLFEGVCTGAADGFGRMNGLPATTLLHLGAGLGNGIANLHNCRRASTPLINIVGDHAVHHVAYDAPLTSDIHAVAKPVSSWIRTSRTSHGVGLDAAAALEAATSPSPIPLGSIATLIVPTDCAWSDGRVGPVIDIPEFPTVAEPVIEDVAQQLDETTMLLIDGSGLSESGVRSAGRIAAATGCQLFSPTFPARVECGPGLPLINRMPYFPEQIIELMGSLERLVLAGGERPVSFFAYQGLPSDLVPDQCEVVRLAHRHEDVEKALSDLADLLSAPEGAGSPIERPGVPEGPLSIRNIVSILGHHVPDNSIVAVDSGSGGAAYGLLPRCVRHSWLNLTGGSIGQGGPAAVGASIACPERRVFALLGDGGAMYTNQYLWTAAREKLPITTVIFSNRQYNILEVEYLRMGVNTVGDKAATLFDLTNPEINWVDLARGQGVAGMRAVDSESFNQAMCEALETDGPYLIEAMV